MRILIAGLGEVGANITRELVRMNVSIAVIDKQQNVVNDFRNLPNVETFVGDILSEEIVAALDFQSYDLFFAITESDEVNMIACSIAKSNNVRFSICRTQKIFQENFTGESVFKELGIQRLVNPIEIISNSLLKVISAPALVDSINLFDDKVVLYGFKVYRLCSMLGISVKKAHADLTESLSGFGIAFLKKSDAIHLSHSPEKIRKGDTLYIYAIGPERKNIHCVRKYLKYSRLKVRKIVINGGGNIGSLIAQKLENQGYSPQIIEKDRKRCIYLSGFLKKTTILNFDGTDEKLLDSERIGSCDLFFSLTENDTVNLLSSKLAGKLGATFCVSLCQDPAFVPVFENMAGIHMAISPRQHMGNYITEIFKNLFSNEIQRALIGRGSFFSIFPLKDRNFEINEIKPSTEINLQNLDKLSDGLTGKIYVFKNMNNGFEPVTDNETILPGSDLAVLANTWDHEGLTEILGMRNDR